MYGIKVSWLSPEELGGRDAAGCQAQAGRGGRGGVCQRQTNLRAASRGRRAVGERARVRDGHHAGWLARPGQVAPTRITHDPFRRSTAQLRLRMGRLAGAPCEASLRENGPPSARESPKHATTTTEDGPGHMFDIRWRFVQPQRGDLLPGSRSVDAPETEGRFQERSRPTESIRNLGRRTGCEELRSSLCCACRWA